MTTPPPPMRSDLVFAATTAIGWRVSTGAVLLFGAVQSIYLSHSPLAIDGTFVWEDTFSMVQWALGVAVVAGIWLQFGDFEYGVADIVKQRLSWPYAGTVWTRWDVPVFTGLFLIGVRSPILWFIVAAAFWGTRAAEVVADSIARWSWTKTDTFTIEWWMPRAVVGVTLLGILRTAIFRTLSNPFHIPDIIRLLADSPPTRLIAWGAIAVLVGFVGAKLLRHLPSALLLMMEPDQTDSPRERKK